jgi:transcriptional regulator with XRE-family HTH domain
MSSRSVTVSGAEVKRLREEHGWTQEQLAARAGVSGRTIQNIESGASVSTAKLRPVAKALGISLECMPTCGEEVDNRIADGLQQHYINFDAMIENRSRGFVGRDFLFEELDTFLNDASIDSGYFWIRGDPGIGKTSFIAELVRRRNLEIYHFNSVPDNIRSPSECLGNLCTRLITRFKLPYQELPDGYDQSSAFLGKLLSEASRQLSDSTRLILAIDALDEAVSSSDKTNSNSMFLPSGLPAHVYVVLTSRFSEDVLLQAMNVYQHDLDAQSKDNIKDVRVLIGTVTRRPGIRDWIAKQGLSTSGFVELMCDKSQGNFMYLHHVLPAVERGEYLEGSVDELPLGLRNYYSRHWSDMRRRYPDNFEAVCEPIVCVLAAVVAPVEIEAVTRVTGLDLVTVRRILREWKEFLQTERISDGGSLYRIYHTSFKEFLQEEVDPGLRRYNTMISDANIRAIRNL